MEASKLIRNSATSIVRFIVLLPIPLLLVPFMLGKLGTQRFGIWAFVSVLSMFTQLGDFGVGYALVKSVAEMKAINNFARLNNILSTALVIYLVFASIIGFVVICVAGIIVKYILHVPENLYNEVQILIVGTGLIFCGNLVLSIYVSVINGLQRMDISNSITFGATILNAIGVWLALSFGGGLLALMINNGVTSIFIGIVGWLALRKINPQIHFRLWNFDKSEAKEVLSYGSNIQVTNLAGLAGDPFLKSMISITGGVGYVAFYDIAMRLLNPLRSLFGQAVVALMPFAAEAQANSNKEVIVKIYKQSIRYIIVFGFPLSTFIFVVLPSFVNSWVGPGYDVSAQTFQALLLGSFVSIISMPSYYIFLSTQVRLTMMIAIANGVLDILLCTSLGYFYGYFGIISGFAIVMVGGSLFSIYMFSKIFNISLSSLIIFLPLRCVVFSIFLGTALWFILLYFSHPGFIGLILFGVIFAVIYCLFLWLSKTITTKELKTLIQNLKAKDTQLA